MLLLPSLFVRKLPALAPFVRTRERLQRGSTGRLFGASTARTASTASASQSSVTVTPRAASFSRWYQDVIDAAGLVDQSPVRGCMILRPRGFALWDAIKERLDAQIRATGHSNAYFPMLLPVSFLSKEAAHVEGFAQECAVVTHHRVRKAEPVTGRGEGGLAGTAAPVLEPDPAAELREPLVIRPTSETIIWDAYRRWISTHRDLPLLLNQWANVMRWEMRTRPFLRTSEFLWQEGHTAHASESEAQAETARMAGVYRAFIEGCLAVPVVLGAKSAAERFAGAVDTLTCEAMMQNGWALQAATSHFLGQNFAKAFDVKFADEKGVRDWVWATSWGASTRLIGAVIMSHSDDVGLVLPPAVAPTQVVVLPIITKQAADKEPALLAAADAVAARLRGGATGAAGSVDAAASSSGGSGSGSGSGSFASWLPPPSSPPLRVAVDADVRTPPGARYFQWERAGVPLRLEIGPRDLDAGTVTARTRIAVPTPVPVPGLDAVAAATPAPTATSASASASASVGGGAVPSPDGHKSDKFTLRIDGSLSASVAALLAAVQRQLFANALARTARNLIPVSSDADLYAIAAEHPAAAQADDATAAPATAATAATTDAASAMTTAAAGSSGAAAADSASDAATASTGGKSGKGSKGGKGSPKGASSAAAASGSGAAGPKAPAAQPLRPHPWIIAPLADDPAVDAILKERRLTVRCFPAALPASHAHADGAASPTAADAHVAGAANSATGAVALDAPAAALRHHDGADVSDAVIDDNSNHRTWAALLEAALAQPGVNPAAVRAVRDGLAGRGRCILTGREGCRVAIIGRAF